MSDYAANAVALRRTEPRLRRLILALVGVVAVAVSAQFSVPLPGTPVPMTLQPLAVLLVGGLLGPRWGGISLLLYLSAGLAGLPVFSPAVPLPGVARLLGPTGGYLLAFPLAAMVAGAGMRPRGGTDRPTIVRVGLHLVVAMAIVHLTGALQLALLGGDPLLALRVGVIPFLILDTLRVLLATLILIGTVRIRRGTT